MNKRDHRANWDRFSRILLDNSVDLRTHTAITHSTVFREGVRKCISEMQKYCEKGARILDLGCGSGFISLELGSLGYLVEGIDVAAGDPKWETYWKHQEETSLQMKIFQAIEKDNIRFHIYDGIRLPFSDQYFDAFVAHGVIEHISVAIIGSLLQEIHRVLRPGGYFFIFRTPRKQSLSEYLARVLRSVDIAAGGHDVLFDEDEVISWLKDHDFKFISSQRTDMIFAGFPYGIIGHKLQAIWNFLSPVLMKIDEALLKTPLSHFAHCMAIICRRPER